MRFQGPGDAQGWLEVGVEVRRGGGRTFSGGVHLSGGGDQNDSPAGSLSGLWAGLEPVMEQRSGLWKVVQVLKLLIPDPGGGAIPADALDFSEVSGSAENPWSGSDAVPRQQL